VVRGKARVVYQDREEIIEAGDAYYLEPGHNLVVEEEGEIVEFSPAGEYQKTMEAVAENL
jgi:mannose-6-phosphate isomerase-like protein (cupin superfamily)